MDKVSAPSVWLVDSSIYVFKAWYTWPEDLCDQSGQAVNATMGFLDFVRQLILEQEPHRLAFAFDASQELPWRNSLYAPYKTNRDPAPENLKYQFGLCRRFIRALGIDEYASARFEADDVIGTLALQAREQGDQVCLVTGDKDLMQLLQPGDWWWEYARDKRLMYDQVEQAIGVTPEQVADLLALAGDKVDNIPGVPGVGMVTGAKLLRRFGSLDNMLEAIEDIGESRLRGAKRIQGLVNEHQTDLRLFRQLTGIRCDIADDLLPLESTTHPDDELEELCELLGITGSEKQQWIKLSRSTEWICK